MTPKIEDIHDTADAMRTLAATLEASGVDPKVVAISFYRIGLELLCRNYGPKEGMDLAEMLYARHFKGLNPDQEA
jgi:hypothetical protein